MDSKSMNKRSFSPARTRLMRRGFDDPWNPVEDAEDEPPAMSRY